MRNSHIETAALNWLTKKLEDEGWTVKRCSWIGYDLQIQKGEEIQYIEVKSTSKIIFSERWLEPKEFDAMNQLKQRYYVYAITNTLNLPELKIFDYESIMKRKTREVIHHYFDFS